MSAAVFYQAVGATLAHYAIDVDGAALIRRGAVTLPANVQYARPHPLRSFLYVVSSNGGPGRIPGTVNVANAFRVAADGTLTPHGEPLTLPARPIHCCVDASGAFLLIAYNHPSQVSVHRIEPDGRLGAPIAQPEALDVGIFAHQIMTTPDNRTAILVTRGNNAEAGRSEDPGALKVFAFADGVLSNRQSVPPDGGLGFGPRHLDFHPDRPWVLVSVERQSELHVYALEGDGTLSRQPLFVCSSLADRTHQGPSQMAGAIHVHPGGRFVYQTNRNSRLVEIDGRKVFAGGENNIAVFALDPANGEPTLIQNAEAPTNHLRTFAIEPSGRLLIAAGLQPIALRDGSRLPAALALYRIGDDGRLTLARQYEVDTDGAMQFWTGIVVTP